MEDGVVEKEEDTLRIYISFAQHFLNSYLSRGCKVATLSEEVLGISLTKMASFSVVVVETVPLEFAEGRLKKKLLTIVRFL